MEEEQSAKWPVVVAPIILILCIITLVLMATWPAHAQQPPVCGPIDEMRKGLAEQFGEHEVGVGLIDDQQSVLTLYASPDGATWTLLAVGAAGSACVISSGTTWTPKPLPKAPVEGQRES